MKKIYCLLLLLAAITNRTLAQGASMSNPINAGSYSSSGSYADTKNNSTGNGFVNNYGQTSNDVWYSFTVGGATNTVVVSMCGSSFDTYLHVLNSGGTEIATNDDNGPACSGLQSSLSLSNLSPGTYYVDAEGYSGNTGTIVFSLNVTIITPITISYAGPRTYSVGTAITAVGPQVGGDPVSPAGQTFTFAGSGSAGSADGTGTAASFNQPLGATVDALGNIYVAEGGSHRIRKITPGGVVTTFAGSGAQGFTNGTGTAASFYHPVGLASDVSGNIYVADEDNNVIRMITPGGAVSTFAGSGSQGINTGAVAAASATFKYPCGVAVDGSGNVYVADTYNNMIRKISGGMVSIFAGNVSGTAGAADGQGTAASFNQPFSVVADAAGNVYVTDRTSAKIRKITSSGLVSTLAGSGTAGYLDATTGTTAQFNAPTGLAIDNTGNLYVADENNNRIRKVTPVGAVTTLSGTGGQGSANGAGTASTFYLPFAVAADAGGLVYSGDLTTNLIRKIVAAPYTVRPALPAGLSLNGATGVISGTPTTMAALATYSITANSSNSTATAPLAISVAAAGPIGLSQDQNYIATYIPRVGALTTDVQVISGSSDKNVEQVGVQYIDGLGRQLQIVQVKGSATGGDVVQPFAYDAYGREAMKYQPYAVSPAGSKGSYQSDALQAGSGLAQFYASPPTGVRATAAPYAQTVFEPSPLNRVTERGAAGSDWQPQPSGTAGHTAKTTYTTNNATAITDTSNTYYAALYTVTIGTDGSRTLAHGIGTQYSYPAGQLNVTVSTDENWKSGRGGTTEEYKDNEGHVVLKRVFNYLPGSPGTMQVLSTYYVYDDIGNLCFVLTPGSGADTMTGSSVPSQAVLDNVCYQYKYDARNRLVEKKVPNKGWEFMIYNQLNEVIFSQDASQRAQTPQVWTFTQYDAFNRVAMTGLWSSTGASGSAGDSNISAPSRVLEQWLNAWAAAQTVLWVTRDNSTATGYAVQNPQGKVLSINYYDTYPAISSFPSSFTAPAGAATTPNGMPTATKVAVLNTIGNPTPDMLWTVHFYDGKGRQVKTYQQHYLGGALNAANYDAVAATYNFNDQVTTTTRQHYTAASGGVKLTQYLQLLYDHAGRKTKAWSTIQNAGQSGDLRTLISKVDYNELGQVWKKNLHSTDSVNFRQTVTYGYNERGWLSTSLSDQFNVYLYYNEPTTGKQYNGNIASQAWQAKGGTATTYTYGYDQLNRLTQGLSTAGNNESNITYDMMGNVKTLSRYLGSALTLIDRLTYTYPANSNQLSSVTDDSGNALGQKAGTATYGYDLNGNLASDDSRGIPANGIAYNLLNLPQSIAALNTTYTYDATGQKLRKVITGTGASTTDYVGGIQYSGTAVDFIQTEEGRAIPNGTNAYNYEYSLTDHLGNSRVNFDTGFGSVARQVQTDDYYPFGMESNGTALGTKSLYLYNKKELQANLSLYDYGARFYDPIIARWTSVDPHAEKYYPLSPYDYVADNPIKSIDGDGKDIIVTNKDQQTQILGYINSRASGNFTFNSKGQLKYLGDKTNTKGTSDYYTVRLQDAIEAKGIIHIKIDPDAKTRDNQGKPTTIKNAGGSTDQVFEEINDKIVHTEANITISGLSYAGALMDADGKPLTADAADILIHELVGHAIPWVAGGDTGNAVDNENKVRADEGKKLRKKEKDHKERSL